jgi:uncharacterized membrane protein
VNGASFSIGEALLGQAVLFLLFFLVVGAVFKEAARILVRVALVVGVVLAVAVVLGWLDKSMVGRWLEAVGEFLVRAIRAVVLWLRDVWEAISNSAGGDK